MKLVKPAEVAEIFGMSAAYIKSHDVSLGMRPLRTVGGQRRYNYEEVQRAIKTLMEKRDVLGDPIVW